RRAEEWKALNVIPVRMAEKNVRIDGFLALGHQRRGEWMRAGAAVENQQVAVRCSQLDAGGVATEVIRGRPGRRDRSARSPKTYSHGLRLPEVVETSSVRNHI